MRVWPRGASQEPDEALRFISLSRLGHGTGLVQNPCLQALPSPSPLQLQAWRSRACLAPLPPLASQTKGRRPAAAHSKGVPSACPSRETSSPHAQETKFHGQSRLLLNRSKSGLESRACSSGQNNLERRISPAAGIPDSSRRTGSRPCLHKRSPFPAAGRSNARMATRWPFSRLEAPPQWSLAPSRPYAKAGSSSLSLARRFRIADEDHPGTNDPSRQTCNLCACHCHPRV